MSVEALALEDALNIDRTRQQLATGTSTDPAWRRSGR
jgi:hypothetical protein